MNTWTPERVILALTNDHRIELTLPERDAIRGAFSSRGRFKGYLLRHLPNKGEMVRAAWLAMQPNPFKASPFSVFMLSAEARVFYDRLSRIDYPAEIDYDRQALSKWGVW